MVVIALLLVLATAQAPEGTTAPAKAVAAGSPAAIATRAVELQNQGKLEDAEKAREDTEGARQQGQALPP